MDKQAGLLKCLDIINLTLDAADTVDIETIWPLAPKANVASRIAV
mgnify:CR=1 FL=1